MSFKAASRIFLAVRPSSEPSEQSLNTDRIRIGRSWHCEGIIVVVAFVVVIAFPAREAGDERLVVPGSLPRARIQRGELNLLWRWDLCRGQRPVIIMAAESVVALRFLRLIEASFRSRAHRACTWREVHLLHTSAHCARSREGAAKHTAQGRRQKVWFRDGLAGVADSRHVTDVVAQLSGVLEQSPRVCTADGAVKNDRRGPSGVDLGTCVIGSTEPLVLVRRDALRCAAQGRRGEAVGPRNVNQTKHGGPTQADQSDIAARVSSGMICWARARTHATCEVGVSGSRK